MQYLQLAQHYADIRVGGLSIELTMLLFAILLGIFQLFIAVQFATRERGTAWNIGPRDETPPLKGKVAGRLHRAFANFRETFPFFAALVLMITVTNKHSVLTTGGAQLYLAARILFVPLYAFGITGLRTLAFLASVVGLVMLIVALFTP
jgi:uncharacterized MAPEG superfamily protein